MKNILVAIDQGGSKTEVILILKNGMLLNRKNDKELRLNNQDDFESQRWSLLANVVRNSLADIGATIEDVGCILAGVCGADYPENITTMQAQVSRVLGIEMKKIIIVNDCIAALRSVQMIKPQKQNYAVIYAGTMFNCALESASSKTYIYGRFVNRKDHGSFSLGYEAWHAIIDSNNGFQEPTLLEKLALKYYNISSLTDLYADFTNGNKVFKPSAFASVLFQAVESKDIIACHIFNSFVHRWIKYVIYGAPKVGINERDRINVGLTGGVFKNCSQQWLEAFSNIISQYNYNLNFSLSPIEPVMGSVLLLLERYNQCPLNDNVVSNIINSPVYDTLLIRSNALMQSSTHPLFY